MAKTFEELLAKAREQKTLSSSVKATLTDLKARLQEALEDDGPTSEELQAYKAEVQTKIDEVFTEIAAGNEELSQAIVEGTEVEPTPNPAPGTVPPPVVTPEPNPAEGTPATDTPIDPGTGTSDGNVPTETDDQGGVTDPLNPAPLPDASPALPGDPTGPINSAPGTGPETAPDGSVVI